MSQDQNSLSYRDAGVDIDAGNELVDRIKPIAAATKRSGVLSGLGGFGGLFELPLDRFKNPVLVSGTDGVGTKLRLAIQADKHDTVGIDLVAMCVNDIVVLGAEPLFFLDYYATGKLSVEQGVSVIKGIAKGCELSGAALLGGETAEMPGMYHDGDYDLAGFAVGLVEKSRIIDGSQVQVGDKIIGIASSGPHSNGYSLIRKIIETSNSKLDDVFEGSTLAEHLLAPTRIYVKSILRLMHEVDLHAIAHITGGGILENIPRVLPAGTEASIQKASWTTPAIFQWLQKNGNIKDDEMLRTFNCGIGMVVVVSPNEAEKACEMLNALGEKAFPVGEIRKSSNDSKEVVII